MKIRTKSTKKGGKTPTVCTVDVLVGIVTKGVLSAPEGETVPSDGTFLLFPATRSSVKMITRYGGLCIGHANRKGLAVPTTTNGIHTLAVACRYDQGRATEDPNIRGARLMFEATQGKGVWEALPQEARDQYVHMVGVITGASKDPLAGLRALVAEVEAEEADGGEPNENSEEPTEAVEAV